MMPDNAPAASAPRPSGTEPIDGFRARASDAVLNWGTTAHDREMSFPCDRIVPAPRMNYYRAIDIAAPAGMVYRWLCQLHIAPYSYDYVDNYGRRSPRRLIPGADEVKIGQRWFLKIFELVEFEPGRHLTFRIGRARWFWGPDVGASYLLVPHDAHSCRVVVNVVTYANPGILATLRRKTYPWGELMMMRKQLLTFKALAEEQTQREAAAGRVLP
jgi:hypothetical protein